MSYLREIMQKLAEAKSQGLGSGKRSDPQEPDRRKSHVDTYRKNLASCNSGMLQYEWIWWQEHIEALELCLTQPKMLEEIGGLAHVEELLAESKECQEVLQDVMHINGVKPASHAHAVHPSDHAWEVSQESIQREWGFA